MQCLAVGFHRGLITLEAYVYYCLGLGRIKHQNIGAKYNKKLNFVLKTFAKYDVT